MNKDKLGDLSIYFNMLSSSSHPLKLQAYKHRDKLRVHASIFSRQELKNTGIYSLGAAGGGDSFSSAKRARAALGRSGKVARAERIKRIKNTHTRTAGHRINESAPERERLLCAVWLL